MTATIAEQIAARFGDEHNFMDSHGIDLTEACFREGGQCSMVEDGDDWLFRDGSTITVRGTGRDVATWSAES